MAPFSQEIEPPRNPGRFTTLLTLHTEYRRETPDGIGYSQFCSLFADYSQNLKPWLRRTYKVGERTMVDYAGTTMPVYEASSGEIRRAQLFVGVLGASNYTYVEAHWSQSLPNWLSAHARMFEFFEGVTEVIVCDNLKSGVKKASRTEPIINDSYQHLADHYDTQIVPARARSPTDKSDAENAVKHVQRQIVFGLRKRKFMSLADLNKAIQEILPALNEKPFQKRGGHSRHSLYEQIERSALKPLPAKIYEYTEFKRLRVTMDYRIVIGECSYSAPYQLCRKMVDVLITANLVEILYQGQRVASHKRREEPGDEFKFEHMPANHREFAEWNTHAALEWAAGIGQHTQVFLRELLANIRVHEQGYRIHTAIKKLENEFSAQRLEAACHRAIHIGAISLTSVRSILRTQLDRVPAHNNDDAQDANFDHENVRGSTYFH